MAKKTLRTEQNGMLYMNISLTALAIAAVYYYGMRAFVIIALSLAVSIACDMFCLKLRKKLMYGLDFGAAFTTGLTLALMLSAATSYYIVVTAAVFASVIGRAAFGGREREVFNPAATGFLFAVLCYGSDMLRYPAPFSNLPLHAVVPVESLRPSSNYSLIMNFSALEQLLDILTGKMYAPMGTAFLLILAVSVFALFIGRSISPISFFTSLAVVSIFSYIYFKGDITNILNLFSSSMLIFGLLFLSCVKRKQLRTKMSWFLFGLLTAGLFILLEFYFMTENAIIYAVLIAAPIGIDMDRRAFSLVAVLNSQSSGFSGFVYKIASKFNKKLSTVSETLAILEERDNPEMYQAGKKTKKPKKSKK